ncbi:hypothetical protein B0H14DRAFT_2576928 [Mycena olivaceomarginata]|nr:hypothetical protein B0H14DRAFT_2576928 [Mycena olivaceomarginata]
MTCSTIFKFTRTIGSWITDDWELVERILDFHPIKNKEHEDEYAGAVMVRHRSEVGVLEKMSSNTFTYRYVDYTIIISITSLQKTPAILNEADDPQFFLQHILPDKSNVFELSYYTFTMNYIPKRHPLSCRDSYMHRSERQEIEVYRK